jgi:hypothetical protein
LKILQNIHKEEQLAQGTLKKSTKDMDSVSRPKTSTSAATEEGSTVGYLPTYLLSGGTPQIATYPYLAATENPL